QAIAAGRGDFQNLPKDLQANAGVEDAKLVETRAKAARDAIASGDLAGAASTARDATAALAKLRERAAKTLSEAFVARERRFAEEFARITSNKDAELVRASSDYVAAIAATARKRVGEGHRVEAIAEIDQARGALGALERELSTAREERDRKLAAA